MQETIIINNSKVYEIINHVRVQIRKRERVLVGRDFQINFKLNFIIENNPLRKLSGPALQSPSFLIANTLLYTHIKGNIISMQGRESSEDAGS